MSAKQSLEAMIESYLRDGPTKLPSETRSQITGATEQITQRRPAAWAVPHRPLLVAAGIVVVIALAGALIGPRVRDLPLVGGRSPESQYLLPGGSDEPYPAPLRDEPSFGPTIVPGRLFDVRRGDTPEAVMPMWVYDDPRDVGPNGIGIVDIVSVKLRKGGCRGADWTCIYFQPAAQATRPLADPRVDWVAWGVVFDRDGDGRADARFGIDNLPNGALRAWLTDLRTGRTNAVVGGNGQTIDHPTQWEGEVPFQTGTSLAGHGYAWLDDASTGPQAHFYVWAAAIRDGRILSLDFAPDTGWIDGRPDE